jgi:hypothetical protein
MVMDLRYEIESAISFLIAIFFLSLAKIYGVDNMKRLGNKILEAGDKWEKENA